MLFGEHALMYYSEDDGFIIIKIIINHMTTTGKAKYNIIYVWFLVTIQRISIE